MEYYMSIVKEDSTVKVHYTGKLESGDVFDSSEGKEPLEFTLGTNQVIPGFEAGVLNMSVGDKKEITIEPDDAYGPSLNELILQVPADNFPKDHDPKIGDQYGLKSPDGRDMAVRVVAIDNENITLDANHPLAGKKLIFELELMDIA
jgi:FKBP-type peptidyl-prolyl cis-trans isomerase 2